MLESPPGTDWKNLFSHNLPAGYSACRRRAGDSAIRRPRAIGDREVTEAKQVPWVSPDVVDDLNEAVAKRWRDLDPMLPAPRDLPDGCMAPFLGFP